MECCGADAVSIASSRLTRGQGTTQRSVNKILIYLLPPCHGLQRVHSDLYQLFGWCKPEWTRGGHVEVRQGTCCQYSSPALPNTPPCNPDPPPSHPQPTYPSAYTVACTCTVHKLPFWQCHCTRCHCNRWKAHFVSGRCS